jgi:hypothetical protein
VQALNTLARMMETRESSKKIFLVACENTVSADDILKGDFADNLTGEDRRRVRGAEALVDRMCVALNEYLHGDRQSAQRTLAVHAGEYGSLKLQLDPDTE